MWVEKEGAYGNAERRTHFWHQLVAAPGEARSDLWQLMEFSSASRPTRSGPARFSMAIPPVSRQEACSTCSIATATSTGIRSARSIPNTPTRKRSIRLLCAKRAVRGVRELRAWARPRPRPVRHLTIRCAACAGRWSSWCGNPLALSRRPHHPERDARQRRAELGCPPNPGRRPARRTRRPSGWTTTSRRSPVRALKHWHSGSMTLRVPELCSMHSPARAARPASAGCARAQPQSRRRIPPAARGAARSGRGSRPRAATARRRAWCSYRLRCERADQQDHAGRHRSDLQADRLQDARGADRSGLRRA